MLGFLVGVIVVVVDVDEIYFGVVVGVIVV